MGSKRRALGCLVCIATALLQVPSTSTAQTPGELIGGVKRSVEAVVLTGAQLGDWSRTPAIGVGHPYPSGTDGAFRDAHNGELTVPPTDDAGVAVGRVAAYRWTGRAFREVPVQIDERFPYFLANGRSDFGVYSGTDKELTYEWDVEAWKKTAGRCVARYPSEDSTLMPGFPTQDPVRRLDDDDELSFMASDTGPRAPTGTAPHGVATRRYEIALKDPLAPGRDRYVYLFLRPGGSSFEAGDGYVRYQRRANADQWIDKDSFAPDDPEKLGTSNRGYGPNLEGTVCDPDGTIRQSDDRFPRDGATVTTRSYKWRASGRWMVRGMRVRDPASGLFGEDLIDRWKGRAFQQSPDSDISVVGFEDEQVNWEGNSALLGELRGPVRAIREVWGADSGTNVTKTEYFYRDHIVYRYRLRVHPIPPDGLYTSWDYNHDTVATYFNEVKTQGVPIDGYNDDIGQVDSIEGIGQAYFDAPDPTHSRPLVFLSWEQVAGTAGNGSLVYMFQLNNVQGLENPTIAPYYRDDACFDDGTGDDPSPRLWPGEALGDTPQEYRDRPCYTDAPEGYEGPYRQGAFGAHGIHYLFVGDTDNGTVPESLTEIDGQQFQWAAPTNAPENVGDRYANTAKAPLVPLATPQP
jgi:hypothetical protein